ncbi:hypothetical protein K435DRAFT_800349 [Dendrothele bispora CBS 962.96]|uniref:F-box domain-containing protein n=1 Tax=Dendrothele bispora (strain CBS 962.96) TaxID=1314807 RepID=A0A4S8LU16_DENBC|nr:hypothetical protein K435DRAFT_800349 [Dendrothele bispora CBS 962.96]
MSVLGLLFHAAKRWEHVDLDINNRQGLDIFPDSRAASPNCSLLKSLNLSLSANFWDFRARDWLRLGSLVKNATSLRNLASSDLDYNIEMSFEENRITSLQLYDDDYGLKDVFRLFPHLQHLDITLGRPSDSKCPKLSSELRSAALKSLIVRIASWRSTPLLSSLRLPSLDSLELLIQLDGSVRDKKPLMSSLETMFRQSSPPLQSFKIDSGHSLTSLQLLDILSWMPSLTDLSIHVISTVLREGFLAQLTYIPDSKSLPTYDPEKSTSSVLLPRLKNLEIGINFETDVGRFIPDMDSVIAMIESRIVYSSLADEIHDDSLVDKLSHLTFLILYFPYHSERAWAEEFRTTLKKRLREHMNQGFTYTVTTKQTRVFCTERL